MCNSQSYGRSNFEVNTASEVQAQHRGQARRLHRLGGSGVAVAQEQVRAPFAVGPGADPVGRGVGAGLVEGLHPRRQRPAVLDHVRACRPPFFPELRDAHRTSLPAQGPDVDVLAAQAGIGGLDRLHHPSPRRAVVDQEGVLRGLVHHGAGEEQVPHVAFVRPLHPQRLVEQVKHRQRSGGLSVGEAGGVLQGVDGGAPDGDARRLHLLVEGAPIVLGVVQHPRHALLEPARHLGTGVDAAVAELRVRAHLGGLAPFGHEPLAQAHHDGVVQVPRGEPQALAHGVCGDGVGVLLDLVELGLVLALPLAEAAEELGAKRGDRHRHGHQPLHAAVQEGDLVGELGGRLAPDPLHRHVLEPQM